MIRIRSRCNQIVDVAIRRALKWAAIWYNRVPTAEVESIVVAAVEREAVLARDRLKTKPYPLQRSG